MCNTRTHSLSLSFLRALCRYAIFPIQVFVQCTTHSHMHARTHINTFFIAASIWQKCAKCSIALGYSKNAKHISQFFDVLWHWFYAAMMVFLLPGLDLSITCHVVCAFIFSFTIVYLCVAFCVLISIPNDFAGARRFWCVWMSVYIMHGIIHGIPSTSTVCVCVCECVHMGHFNFFHHNMILCRKCRVLYVPCDHFYRTNLIMLAITIFYWPIVRVTQI